jgi:hypothetical protein
MKLPERGYVSRLNLVRAENGEMLSWETKSSDRDSFWKSRETARLFSVPHYLCRESHCCLGRNHPQGQHRSKKL